MLAYNNENKRLVNRVNEIYKRKEKSKMDLFLANKAPPPPTPKKNPMHRFISSASGQTGLLAGVCVCETAAQKRLHVPVIKLQRNLRGHCGNDLRSRHSASVFFCEVLSLPPWGPGRRSQPVCFFPGFFVWSGKLLMGATVLYGHWAW